MDLIESSRKRIGENIRIRREQIGMTMDELARLMGYKNRSSIAKIENGENTVPSDKMALLAFCLHTDVPSLFGWVTTVPINAEEKWLLDMWKKADNDAQQAVKLILRRFEKKDIASSAG